MKTLFTLFIALVSLCVITNTQARKNRHTVDESWKNSPEWRQEWENHIKPHIQSGKRTRTVITYPSYYYPPPYYYDYYTNPPPVTYQQPIFPIKPPTNASVSSYYDTDGMIVHYYIDPSNGQAYYYSNDASGNVRYFVYDTNGSKVYYNK